VSGTIRPPEAQKKDSLTPSLFSFLVSYLPASADCTIKVWDLTFDVFKVIDSPEIPDFACLATFKGHTDAVTCLYYCKEKGMVISGSADQTIRCWKWPAVPSPSSEAIPERVFEGHGDMVLGVTVINDQIVSASLDHTIRTWSFKVRNKSFSPFFFFFRFCLMVSSLCVMCVQNGKNIGIYDLSNSIGEFRVDFKVITPTRAFLISLESFAIHLWSLKASTLFLSPSLLLLLICACTFFFLLVLSAEQQSGSITQWTHTQSECAGVEPRPKVFNFWL
jgi:WD40 repeat protein